PAHESNHARPNKQIQKGRDYIQTGDKYRDRGDFKDAAKYYERAIKYCPEEAQARLKELPLRSPLPDNNGSPGDFSARLDARIKRLKDSIPKFSRNSAQESTASQKTEFAGPYFPHTTLSPQAMSVLQTPSLSQVTEKMDYTMDKPQTTRYLVNLFIHADSNADINTKIAIRSRIQQVIKRFDMSNISFDTVQELVVLAAIPDRDIFLNIINQMLKVLCESPILLSIVLQGLAVILNSCPEQIDLTDMHGVFLDILSPLANRLKVIRLDRNDGQLLPLLQALSVLLDSMVCRKVFALNRKSTHAPLNSLLDSLTSHADVTVRFLAIYSKQALAFIGNDESLPMSIIRRGTLVFALVGDVRDIVTNMDLSKFESAYQNFTSLCDFTVRSSWYQGLIYLDCVIRLEDWPRFESFVLDSKLKSNELFLQGVCLYLEQIASTHTNVEVRNGAVVFLHALGSKSHERVHQFAQHSLHRLGIVGNINQSATGTLPLTAPEQTARDGMPPIWSPSWYKTPSNVLLNSVQAELQRQANIEALPNRFQDLTLDIQTGNHNITKTVETGFAQLKTDISQIQTSIGKIGIYKPSSQPLPSSQTPPSLAQIHAALQVYYKPFLAIQRVSGDTLDLESCYINLAIVEAPGQRQKDKEELKANAFAFHRMPSFEEITKTNMQAPVPLEDLFNKRELRDGRVDVPRTVMIQGRAGIGKTTLCKKLVHAYQSGLWRDLFDAVLWLPLRQLKALKSRNLEDLLCEKYLSRLFKSEKEMLGSTLASRAREGRILFVLDGLDEIVADTQTECGFVLAEFLKDLLQQDHVVITSRPSGIDTSILPKLDLEFETVGFSSQNVSDYLHKTLSPEVARAVQEFIQRTPLIQDLVNIPVQLDVICYSWDSFPSSEESVTMTALYQTMVRKLWCKDAARLQKSADGREHTLNQLKRLRPYQIDELMAIEIEYFGYLAFKGMKNNHQIEFDESALLDAIEDLDRYRENANQSQLPLRLLDDLKQTSFLHTADAEVDSDKDGSQHAWYFLHLTFQEYFAATWLARHLRNKQATPTPIVVIEMTDERTAEFIQEQKYNPRYEIVWWMVAGLLEGERLEDFFDLLQGAPCDLIGGRHQLLLAGCLKEARHRLKNGTVKQLEDELMQWLHFDRSLCYGGNNSRLVNYILSPEYKSHLGSQTVFPEELLIKCLSQADETKEFKRFTLRTLKGRPRLTSTAIEGLADTSKIKDGEIMVTAIEIIGFQSNFSEFAALTLIGALQHKWLTFSDAAAKALCNRSIFTESAIFVLTSASQHEELSANMSASESTCVRSNFPESAILALVNVLPHENSFVRGSAAEVLHYQSTLPQSAITALTNSLQHENPITRGLAAQVLGSHSPLPESTILALISALQDEEFCVKDHATDALCSESTLPESAIMILSNTLQDEDPFVRSLAAEIFRRQITLPESVISVLTNALQDEDWSVVNSAVKALGNQTALPESSILALVDSLKHKHTYVRSSIAKALGNQSVIPESAMSILIQYLQYGLPSTRSSAAEALDSPIGLPESAISALVNNLVDQDCTVRDSAVKSLSRRHTLSLSTVSTLTNLLQDDHWHVRSSAAKVLGGQSKLPESSIFGLATRAIKDKNSGVRKSAVYALGNQSTLPESTISDLIYAIYDDDWNVGSLAVRALGNQNTLSTSTALDLVDSLHHHH
ncbi:hypothetical protein BGX26_003073, partial [Mortierella sp. AD094]